MNQAEDTDFLGNSIKLPIAEEIISNLRKARVKTKVERPFFGVIFIFSFVFLVIYGLLSRPIKETLFYSSIGTIPFLILIITLSFLQTRSAPVKSTKKENTFSIILLLFVSFFASIFYYCLFVSIKDISSSFVSFQIWQKNSIVLTVILTFTIGLVLFLFRLKARAIYGITEIFIGLIVSVNKIETNSHFDYTFYLAMLTAGVYLVVRGMDNFHQGITKEPIDPFIKYIVRRINPNMPEKFKNLV